VDLIVSSLRGRVGGSFDIGIDSRTDCGIEVVKARAGVGRPGKARSASPKAGEEVDAEAEAGEAEGMTGRRGVRLEGAAKVLLRESLLGF
jgi:hypothetical protein